jgi:hypothetical protein
VLSLHAMFGLASISRRVVNSSSSSSAVRPARITRCCTNQVATVLRFTVDLAHHEPWI